MATKGDQSNMPAFPAMDMNSYEGVDRMELRYEGLTKREYFAGLAMQGILSNPDSEGYALGNGKVTNTGENKAKFCVIMADELLKALEDK